MDADTFINILLYADDIVLLAKNEEDLQFLLNLVETWCKKWRLEVNLTKTNILHVRQQRKPQSNFMFLFDRMPVAYCTFYKYLGCTINEPGLQIYCKFINRLSWQSTQLYYHQNDKKWWISFQYVLHFIPCMCLFNIRL